MKKRNLETEVKIDVSENAVYIANDGVLTKIPSKKHGQDVVFWKEGRVLDVERKERVRLTGQEEI